MSDLLKFYPKDFLRVQASPGTEDGIFDHLDPPVVAGAASESGTIRMAVTLIAYDGLYFFGINARYKNKNDKSSIVFQPGKGFVAGNEDIVEAASNLSKAVNRSLEANDNLIANKEDRNLLAASLETLIETLEEKGVQAVLIVPKQSTPAKAPAKKTTTKKTTKKNPTESAADKTEGED